MTSIPVKWQTFQDDRNVFITPGAEFSDVTLACDDNHQLPTHKIILSAGSLTLREILTNSKHPHPFIYLSGLGKTELCKIVELLYHGETHIAESDLETFLKAARLLRIIGTENNEIVRNDKNVTPPMLEKDSEMKESLTECNSGLENKSCVEIDENVDVIDQEQSGFSNVKPGFTLDKIVGEADFMKTEEDQENS